MGLTLTLLSTTTLQSPKASTDKGTLIVKFIGITQYVYFHSASAYFYCNLSPAFIPNLILSYLICLYYAPIHPSKLLVCEPTWQ